MTLTSLLEIDRTLLAYEDERALQEANRIWVRKGSPVAYKELCEALEEILVELVQIGIGYPKVLLKRKKQLERRDWKPRERAESESSNGTAPVGSCLLCWGTGLKNLPDGKSGTFCDCDAGRLSLSDFAGGTVRTVTKPPCRDVSLS
jgi:hypothetical protein